MSSWRFVAAGAAMTLRQVRASREGHTIDLFTKAIDQLASADASVRTDGDTVWPTGFTSPD